MSVAAANVGDHAAIYTTGSTAEEAQTKLIGALGKLNLLPKTTIKGARWHKRVGGTVRPPALSIASEPLLFPRTPYTGKLFVR